MQRQCVYGYGHEWIRGERRYDKTGNKWREKKGVAKAKEVNGTEKKKQRKEKTAMEREIEKRQRACEKISVGVRT